MQTIGLRIIFLALICLIPVQLLTAQVSVLKETEGQLKQVLQRGKSASVRAFGWDSDRGRQNSAQFSAVSVSADGYLLTVAHAVRPGKLYKVSFPDGREGFAKSLGVIEIDENTTWPDVALMKMEGNDLWPYVEMGITSDTRQGEWCFGVSYPESLNLLQPTVRFGKIIDPLDERNYLQSTSIMETGDSGGPLFDAAGRVIALHSRIDRAEGRSFEVPVDTYRKYWSALVKDSLYRSWPSEPDEIYTSLSGQRVDFTSFPHHPGDLVANYHPKKIDVSHVVSIASELDGNTKAILGTVIKLSNKNTVIISKSSEVGGQPSMRLDKEEHMLSVLYRDRATDLVFLSAEFSLSSGLDYKEGSACVEQGKFLFSAFPNDSLKISVTGLVLDSLPLRFSAGGIDFRLQEIGGLPTILDLDPSGAGSKAGLMKEDQIILINEIDVSSAAKINAQLVKFYPGDTLAIQFIRQADTLSTSLTLGRRVVREQNHAMNHFKGGKSLRRAGFSNVFVHDSRLYAYECGGPVYDSSGNFQGINIARFSHTAVLALNRCAIAAAVKRFEHTQKVKK